MVPIYNIKELTPKNIILEWNKYTPKFVIKKIKLKNVNIGF
jgi:hypothetical protein